MLGTEQEYSDYFAQGGAGLPTAYGRLARFRREGLLEFAEGFVRVDSIGADGDICEAKIVWDLDHGEQVLDVGPVADILDRIGEITRYGPAYGPAYQPGRVLPVLFPTDGSYRMVTAQGEVRLKRFLQQRVVLFVPHNPGGRRSGEAVRIVRMWPAELGPFAPTVQVCGSQWSEGRFLAVLFRGRLHKLRVSNFPGELAFCRVDDKTRLVLVPHALEGDGPARVEVQLIRVDTIIARLGTCPIDADLAPDSAEQVVWSDVPETSPEREAQERSDEPAAAAGVPWSRRVHRSAAPPRAAAGRKDASHPEEQGPPHPALVPLLHRYFGDLADEPGVARGLRGLVGRPGDGMEISPMMRAVQRGVNLRGHGGALWRDLEAAGEFASVWHSRVSYYFLARLERDGVICRRCVDSTQRMLTLGDFCNPHSIASRNLCGLYGLTPERVLAEWETSRTGDRGAAHEPGSTSPPPSPPPPTPHAGQGSEPTSARSATTSEPTVNGHVGPVPRPAGATPPSSPDPPASEFTGPPRAPTPAPPPFPKSATASCGDVSASGPPHPSPTLEPPRPSPAAGQHPVGPPPGPFRAPAPPRPSSLTVEHLRFRPRYPSDDGEIQDISDDGEGNDGSARGPPSRKP